jgi:hypothetical protein
MMTIIPRPMMNADPEAVMDCIEAIARSLDECRNLLHDLRYQAELTFRQRGLCSDCESRARRLITRATSLGVIPAAHPNDRWGA